MYFIISFIIGVYVAAMILSGIYLYGNEVPYYNKKIQARLILAGPFIIPFLPVYYLIILSRLFIKYIIVLFKAAFGNENEK